MLHLETDVSGCEVRGANTEGRRRVCRATVASNVFLSDLGNITTSALQCNALLRLGNYNPLSAGNRSIVAESGPKSIA